MNLTRRQKEILVQLDAEDDLLYDEPTRLYSIGSPRKGWVRLTRATVDKLLAHVLIKFDVKVGYTRRAQLTKEGRALARELAKACEHERRIQGRCIYCGQIV